MDNQKLNENNNYSYVYVALFFSATFLALSVHHLYFSVPKDYPNGSFTSLGAVWKMSEAIHYYYQKKIKWLRMIYGALSLMTAIFLCVLLVHLFFFSN